MSLMHPQIHQIPSLMAPSIPLRMSPTFRSSQAPCAWKLRATCSSAWHRRSRSCQGTLTSFSTWAF